MTVQQKLSSCNNSLVYVCVVDTCLLTELMLIEFIKFYHIIIILFWPFDAISGAVASLHFNVDRRHLFVGLDNGTITVSSLRGFAKLKQFQKSKKKLDRAHPTHPPPSKLFFGNPSLTWTEPSNHNNQQLLAMYTDRIHMVYYSKISVLPV